MENRQQFVNGKVFDYSSITIDMTGCTGIEPTSVEYEDSQEKEVVYGKGGNTRGFGTGNKSNTVKLEMLREDYNTMMDAYKKDNGNFYEIIIPKITVSYANPGATTCTDVLTNVTFNKRAGFGGKQGDKSLTITLEGFAAGGIEVDGMPA